MTRRSSGPSRSSPPCIVADGERRLMRAHRDAEHDAGATLTPALRRRRAVIEQVHAEYDGRIVRAGCLRGWLLILERDWVIRRRLADLEVGVPSPESNYLGAR